MRNESRSLYQVLGVAKDATPNEIERAYRRIKAEMQKETTPPDPRLRVLVEHAHDVLTDPVRREAYEREWFAPKAQIQRARRSPAALAAMAAAVIAVAAAAWMALREPAAPPRTARAKSELQSAVALAVGRVNRIEVSGASAPLGLAFAIAEGTLVTSCEGLSPNAEVIVRFGARAAPVRASAVDEATGLCRLTGGSVGSWPLELARSEPASGERVYFVGMREAGDAQLGETQFRKALKAGDTRAYETELPPNVHDLGGPLLDVEGRVVGAASRVGGSTLYVPVPRTWLPEVPVQRSAPEPRAPRPEPKAGEGERPPGPDISPERRERLEKAFRPPPQVPDDI